MKIAIDFDGTCVTHAFPEIGKEIGAPRVLRELVDSGHELILFTMRSNCADNTGFSQEVPEIHNGNFLDDAVKWFEGHGIPLYGINTNPEQTSWTTSPKAYAQLYIDDAALGCPLVDNPEMSDRPFVDWNEVRGRLIYDGVIKPKMIAV